MKKNLIFTFTFLFFSMSSHASFTINDPNNLLHSVDTYLAADSFDEAFKIDDSVMYETTRCTYTRNTDGRFSSECDPISESEEYVFAKNSDQVEIREQGSQGSLIITRQMYDSSNGNYLRSYLESMRNYQGWSTIGTDIEKISFESVSISGITVQAIRVFYTIEICQELDEALECFLMPEEMLLGRGLMALGQVIEHIPNRLVPDRTPIAKLIEFSRL